VTATSPGLKSGTTTFEVVALASTAVPGGAPVDGGVAEAAAPPTCGSPPARFTILAGDASPGLVRDNVTNLTWMRNSTGGGEPPQTQSDAAGACAQRGMRLPTEGEAMNLAANYASCAFGQWSTWTSTADANGDAWVVDYTGGASPQLADNFPSAVLCVEASTTP
jgi:hypothetical protein